MVQVGVVLTAVWLAHEHGDGLANGLALAVAEDARGCGVEACYDPVLVDDDDRVYGGCQNGRQLVGGWRVCSHLCVGISVSFSTTTIYI